MQKIPTLWLHLRQLFVEKILPLHELHLCFIIKIKIVNYTIFARFIASVNDTMKVELSPQTRLWLIMFNNKMNTNQFVLKGELILPNVH